MKLTTLRKKYAVESLQEFSQKLIFRHNIIALKDETRQREN